VSAERFPVDLVVTAADFDTSGWRDVLKATAREGYSSMWQAFSAAARTAIAEGRSAHGKVLWLLADACSMMLSPGSVNEPFKPFMVMDGKRSVIADDLADADIAFGRVNGPAELALSIAGEAVVLLWETPPEA